MDFTIKPLHNLRTSSFLRVLNGAFLFRPGLAAFERRQGEKVEKEKGAGFTPGQLSQTLGR